MRKNSNLVRIIAIILVIAMVLTLPIGLIYMLV